MEATTLTGLGVAASVLVASTGLGLWRRHRDGRMRPVGHMASSPAPKIAPTAATPGQPGDSASHETAASAGAAARKSGSAAAGKAGRDRDAASVAAGGAAAGKVSKAGKDRDAASVAAGGATAGKVSKAGRDRDAAVSKAGEPLAVEDGLLAGLGVEAGTPVTLLQFSSAFCAPCRATRRVCDEVSEMLDGVRHIEVDAEAHLDAVRALNIWRTPTVLVIDAAGRVVQRASGQPSKAHVIAAVAPLLDGVVVPS